MVKLTEILEIIVRSIINLNLCPTLLYRLLIFPTNFVTGQNAILYVPRCNYQNGKTQQCDSVWLAEHIRQISPMLP